MLFWYRSAKTLEPGRRQVAEECRSTRSLSSNWTSGKLRTQNGPLTSIVGVYAVGSIRRVFHRAGLSCGKGSRNVSASPEGSVLEADLDTVVIAVDTQFFDNGSECSQRAVCGKSKSIVRGGLAIAMGSTAVACCHATGTSDRYENQPLQQVPLVTAH